MAGFYPAIQHTTNTCLALGKGEVHSSILCGSTSLKALVIQAFFKRNTPAILPYSKRVVLNFGLRRNTLTTGPVLAHPSSMIILYVAAGAAGLLLVLSIGAELVRLAVRYWWLCLAVAVVVAAGAASAADRTRPTLADEIRARPACVGIVGDKAWADCMAKFRDVRPQHEPTTLVFKDWRT